MAEIESKLIASGFQGPTVKGSNGQRIWTHDDGSVVRIKPNGDMGGPRAGQPHLVKEHSKTPHAYGKEDIAHKFTDDGKPIPKDPKTFAQEFAKRHKRQPSPQEVKEWADKAHIDIKP